MRTPRFLYFSLLVLALLVLLGSTGCGEGQKATAEHIIDGDTGADLDSKLAPLVQNALASFELPGLAVGVVKDSDIIYARGFGDESLATKKPVTIHTIFHLASISKPFVATAIVRLVEEGKIDLDAPVITYLPYFRLEGDQYGRITIRQMLTHTSGMPDVEDYEWDNPQYDEGALERYVRSLATQKMLHQPGENFRYSNMAFECLGDVIAKVSGIPFADYVKKTILDPSGMEVSTFLKPDYLPENWAAPHVRTIEVLTWEGYPYNRMHGPSSTLHSNALEMCRWAMTNLNRGQHKGNRILAESSYELLWKPQAEIGGTTQVGLSWFIGEYKGEKAISHGGGDVGFNTMLILLPERAVAVIVLCNFIPAPVRAIAGAALDIVLGEEPDRLIPPASLQVFAKYRQDGLAAAVETWKSLEQAHSADYDFNTRQFSSGLYTAIRMKRARDAEDISRLCSVILPEDQLKALQNELSEYLGQHPESEAAIAAVKMLQEKPGKE